MLRHSVLWTMRDPLSPASRLAMLRRLAYLGTEPGSVSSGDYGADLFGGSRILHEVRPSRRVPTWRRSSDGPVCNFDMALHLDFADWDAYRAYADDPTHDQASAENERENWDELTARVDWYYERQAPPTHAGEVKHVAMFLWEDGVSDAAKEGALDAAGGLEGAAGAREVLIGQNVGGLRTDYDWILDVRLADPDAAEAFLASAEHAQAMRAVAEVTRYEWTARMSHAMHRP